MSTHCHGAFGSRSINSKCYLLLVLWLTIIVRILLWATPVLAEEALRVIIGQDSVFETCNWHDKKTEVAPYHPGKLPPTTLYSDSSGQIAVSQVIAGSNQEGIAGAWVGFNFSVAANEDGEQAREAEISITVQFDAAADFNVDTGGSTQARILTEIAGNLDDVVMINFVQNSDKDARSGSKTITRKVLLEAGKGYVVYAHSFAMADIYETGTANTQCSVSIQDVKVKFVRKIYGLFIGVTQTHNGVTLKGVDEAQYLEGVFRGIDNVAHTLSITMNLDYTIGVDKERIHSAIKAFDKMILPGDIFFLYYSGHGGQIRWDTLHNEYLALGSDDPYWVYDNELASWLKEMKPAISKWVILDTCHSGGFLEEFISYGLTNFSFLASAETGVSSWFDFHNGFGLFSQALFDGLKRNQDGKMAVDPQGDGFGFRELFSYIVAWWLTHKHHYTDKLVFQMDLGDPVLCSDDLFNPVAFQSSDFIDGMPTGQKRIPITAAIQLLLIE
jgi:hypothetical protein